MSGNDVPESAPGTSQPKVSADENGAAFDELAMPTMYCVTPLENCPHLELIAELPESGLDPTACCETCHSPEENWVCLHCYKVFCGRFVNQHMLEHGKSEGHPLTLSYSDLSVWCYECDAYVHNPVLTPAKEQAHVAKFGSSLG